MHNSVGRGGDSERGGIYHEEFFLKHFRYHSNLNVLIRPKQDVGWEMNQKVKFFLHWYVSPMVQTSKSKRAKSVWAESYLVLGLY